MANIARTQQHGFCQSNIGPGVKNYKQKYYIFNKDGVQLYHGYSYQISLIYGINGVSDRSYLNRWTKDGFFISKEANPVFPPFRAGNTKKVYVYDCNREFLSEHETFQEALDYYNIYEIANRRRYVITNGKLYNNLYFSYIKGMSNE